MTRICIINPVTNREFEKIDSAQLSKYIPAGVEITISSIGRGPASIESHLDEALAIPGILERVKEVQTKADAIVLNCFGDPGVEAAREISRIPIIGPGATSMVFATFYGFRFSVITVLKQLEPYPTDMAVKLGIDQKLASIRSVEIPVL